MPGAEEVPFAERQQEEEEQSTGKPSLMTVAVAAAASGAHLRIEQIWDCAVDSQHHHPNALHNIRSATQNRKKG